MTYRGKVTNGVAVFEGDGKPSEGSTVLIVAPATIEPVAASTVGDQNGSIWQALLELAGSIEPGQLPTDGSVQHDHYIYGTPKQ